MIYNMLVNLKFLFCNNFFKTIATPSLLRCKYREKNWKGKKFFERDGEKYLAPYSLIIPSIWETHCGCVDFGEGCEEGFQLVGHIV